MSRFTALSLRLSELQTDVGGNNPLCSIVGSFPERRIVGVGGASTTDNQIGVKLRAAKVLMTGLTVQSFLIILGN